MHFNAFTVPDIPLVEEGDDLAEIICKNARLCNHDIVVIASTVVAKAEGRVTRLAAITPSDRAITIAEQNESDSGFVQAVLDESEDIILESPFLLVKTRNGNICVNAGIDGSNIDSGQIILLPEDPDGSAKNIREAIFAITAKTVSADRMISLATCLKWRMRRSWTRSLQQQTCSLERGLTARRLL